VKKLKKKIKEMNHKKK